MKKILTLLILISPLSAQAALTDGLVGYWTLDGKDVNWATGVVSDLSGQGNSGKVVSMSTSTSPAIGKVGQALNFDGVNDYIDAGNTSALQITGAITVSAWIRATTTATNGGIAGKYNSATSQRGYLLAQENVGGSKKITWYYQNLAGTFDAGDAVTTVSDVLDNRWHHVVGVYSPSSYGRIYVDGVLDNEDTTSIDSSIANNTAVFAIGAFNSGAQTINSKIDDVRVYNRALSAQEVRQLYSLGATKFNASPTALIPNGLVGYWSFDGNTVSGTTVQDLSRSGANGTLNSNCRARIGRFGQGIECSHSAVNGFMYSALSSALDDIPRVTLSFWGKMNSGNAFLKGSYWGLSVSSGFSMYNRTFSNSPGFWTDSRSYTLNSWHHFVLTYDATSVSNIPTLYIDGAGSQMSPLASPSGSVSSEAGLQLYTPASGATGIYDDIRVYNRILSAAEVLQLYKSGSAQVGATLTAGAPTGGLSSGLVGYWTLDGNDTNWATGSVTDRSGQGNTGKVVSMSTTTSPILGKIGQALNFDGADDYVNVSNSIAGVQTVSYWIKGATSTNGGIELNSNAWIDDLAIPQGFTSPSVYIDGVLQGSLVGSELLPNNNFASNITSWTEMNVCGTAATSWVNGVSGDGSTGYLRFTTQNNVCADRFRVTGSITSGAKSYRVSFWYKTTTIAVNPAFYSGDDFTTLANSKTFSLPVTSSAWRYTSRVLSTTGASYPIVGVYHYTPSGDAAGTIDLDGVSLKEITTRYPITDTKWHHVVITTGTGITADAIKLGRGNLFINGSGSYLSGTMDDVRIYNRALSAQEVRQLYNLGRATLR